MINDKIVAIYCLRNKVNNKVYIGSSANFIRRKNDHLYKLRHNTHCNTHLQNAWNKYGEDNFEFEILLIVNDTSKLISIETLYINLFDCCNGDIGYNICKIAKSCLGVKHSEQTKEKARERMKGKNKGENNPMFGRKLSEEAKKQIGIKNSGINNAHYGKPMPEETKRKLSEAMKNKERKDIIVSEETRKKIGDAHRNKIVSEETRKKLSTSIRAWNAKNHCTRSILSIEQVVQVKLMLKDNIKCAEIAKLFNVSYNLIFKIKQGYTWSEITI